MNTDQHHQPKVYPGDAKKEGESDDAHQRRVHNNAKSRAFAASARAKRLANEAKNRAILAAGVPMRGPAFVDADGNPGICRFVSKRQVIEKLAEKLSAKVDENGATEIRGFAFGDEKEEATEVLPLPPPINVVVATPPAPPATVVESALPKYKKRIEELQEVLRIKDMVLAYHIKEITTKDFIIRRLEECLRMREVG